MELRGVGSYAGRPLNTQLLIKDADADVGLRGRELMNKVIIDAWRSGGSCDSHVGRIQLIVEWLNVEG